MNNPLGSLRVNELLRLYCGILDELRARNVCRSTNNPVADLSELLVIKALGLSYAAKSTKGYDATDADGKRYEIKGRRVTSHNRSRMLSAIRDCDAQHFDFLGGVLFRKDFTLDKACVVPFEVVLRLSKYRKRTNAHIFELKDEVWNTPGVLNISAKLTVVLADLDAQVLAAAGGL